MASTRISDRIMAGYRRSAFEPEEVATRPMPSKVLASPAERIKPSVSADVARVAEFLCSDTVTQGIFAQLRKEAVDKLTASALGAEGAPIREVARYELEALSTIEERLRSMAAEIRLFQEPETMASDLDA